MMTKTRKKIQAIHLHKIVNSYSKHPLPIFSVAFIRHIMLQDAIKSKIFLMPVSILQIKKFFSIFTSNFKKINKFSNHSI
jgi:hypothetical protein